MVSFFCHFKWSIFQTKLMIIKKFLDILSSTCIAHLQMLFVVIFMYVKMICAAFICNRKLKNFLSWWRILMMLYFFFFGYEQIIVVMLFWKPSNIKWMSGLMIHVNFKKWNEVLYFCYFAFWFFLLSPLILIWYTVQSLVMLL